MMACPNFNLSILIGLHILQQSWDSKPRVKNIHILQKCSYLVSQKLCMPSYNFLIVTASTAMTSVLSESSGKILGYLCKACLLSTNHSQLNSTWLESSSLDCVGKWNTLKFGDLGHVVGGGLRIMCSWISGNVSGSTSRSVGNSWT